jgi:hypothetical protein
MNQEDKALLVPFTVKSNYPLYCTRAGRNLIRLRRKTEYLQTASLLPPPGSLYLSGLWKKV